MPKAIVAMAAAAIVAAVAAAVLAGCPSLSALECQGTAAACADGGGSGIAGIACGTGDLLCAAPAQECCITEQNAPACVAAFQCSGGTDIFCDDPSQCGGAPCYLCNAGGLQGTSCRYQEDIVEAYHCTDPKDVYRLCHSSSECDAGSTCSPIPIVLPWSDGGSAGFYGCQP
jgi:hypothetical protein